MRRILRRREIISDPWRYPGEQNPTGPGEQAPPGQSSQSDPLIVPLADFLAEPASWHEYAGPLGLKLTPADSVERLAAHLDRLALIAVEFPGPGDGRGYTQARLLRTRLKFKGELRAVGAGVKQDLLFIMSRCGIDSFELAAGQDFEAALASLDRYTVAYQPGAPVPAVRRQRFLARTAGANITQADKPQAG